MQRTARGKPARAVVVQPPLLLSSDFIDYPYLALLGAYQAAAVLRRSGLEVEILDGFTATGADLLAGPQGVWLGESEESYLARLQGLEQALVIVNASPFLLAAPGRRWLGELMRCITRSAPSLVVLAELYTGGMHYLETDPGSWMGDLPGLDLVLRYEGEKLLERLAECTACGRLPRGEVWENREAFSLDELPPPAWDLLDAEGYFAFLARVLGSSWRPGPFPAQPRRTLPLVTARGCPFGCVFCTRNPGLPGPRRQVRAIPMEQIARWVQGWVSEMSLQRLVVLDEVANLEPVRFEALLSLVARFGLRIDLPNGLRADRLSEDHVRKLGRLTSGLKVSLESASPRVQDKILGKRLDPAAVKRVARWCQEQGLPLEVHCLIGIPGERRSEILATLEMACRLHEQHGARVLLQYATPLPGTELEQICREQGLLVPPADDDPWAAFQHRGIIRTAEFDPDLLATARQVLERRLAGSGPRKVIVNLTYRCNNRCVFCAVGDRRRQDADAHEVSEALGRYRRAGFELLDIDGGEPTLHEDLFRIIEQAAALGYHRIALVTNGRRLGYPSYARRLARSGLHEVLISLHAHEPGLGERLTGVPESFHQTVAGIGRMLQALPDGQQLAVNTTLVAENLPFVERLAELLAGLGVARWNLQVVTPFGRAHRGLAPAEEHLRLHLGGLLDRPPRGMRIQIINCPPCLLPGHESATGVDFGKADRDMVFVGATGENLQAFLSRRRQRTGRCAKCIHALVCAGEYVF